VKRFPFFSGLFQWPFEGGSLSISWTPVILGLNVGSGSLSSFESLFTGFFLGIQGVLRRDFFFPADSPCRFFFLRSAGPQDVGLL